jgi:AraC-like DNA-binding protein
VFASAIYYMLIPESEKAAQLADILAGENMYINLINLFLLLHICGYLYVAWKQVLRYARGAAELDMDNVAKSVNWQKSLLGCICAVNVALLLAFAVPVIITGSAHIYSDLIATPVAALLIYVFMMYKGLSYHVIYNRVEYDAFARAAEPLNNFVAEVNSSQPLYKEEMITDKKAELLRLFEEKKIFTTGSLKLHDVAEMLEISPAALSYIINKQLHMTFFEMVNKYRVEEAKQLFVCPDHQHYKIESIGKLSGFNSKASFYAVFKKLTGKTPQVFREEQGLC